jgi:hypothetical protein
MALAEVLAKVILMVAVDQVGQMVLRRYIVAWAVVAYGITAAVAVPTAVEHSLPRAVEITVLPVRVLSALSGPDVLAHFHQPVQEIYK